MRHLVVATAHEFVAERIGFYFSKRGFRVELVTDNEGCLDKRHRKAPDAVILDDGLPSAITNGVLNRFRENPGDTLPIVLLTDRPNDERAAAGRVRAFLKRPTDIETLFNAVNAVVRR